MIEGAYTFICDTCAITFGVVSKLSVGDDQEKNYKCPSCSEKVRLFGEGHITHEEIKQELSNVSNTMKKRSDRLDDLPKILSVDDIAALLNVSVRRAYEIMDIENFPLIRIGNRKRVFRDKFFIWLDNNTNI